MRSGTNQMSLSAACIFLAIVALAPLAAYLFRRGGDPFSPLILIGGVAFGIVDLKLLRDPRPALRYFPASAYVEYLLIVALSLLSVYAGWHWRGRRGGQRAVRGGGALRAFDPGRLMKAGLLMAVMALIANLLSLHNVFATGYVKDWYFMQGPAAILLIQAYMLDRRLLWPVLAGLGAALFGCINWFFVYGGRGDTAVLLSLVAVPFLFRGARPRKHWVLIFGFAAAVAMMTLAETRSIVGKG